MNARVHPVTVAEAKTSAFATHKTSAFATHEVRNQARPATGFNAFDDDRALSDLIARMVPWAKDRLSALGAHAGSEAVQEAARLANEHEPKLLAHLRIGVGPEAREIIGDLHGTEVGSQQLHHQCYSTGRDARCLWQAEQFL